MEPYDEWDRSPITANLVFSEAETMYVVRLQFSGASRRLTGYSL